MDDMRRRGIGSGWWWLLIAKKYKRTKGLESLNKELLRLPNMVISKVLGGNEKNWREIIIRNLGCTRSRGGRLYCI